MRCNGSNWAVYSPGSWDGFRNDVWPLWAGVIMRLEHHLVGGYVCNISPHIIIIIITRLSRVLCPQNVNLPIFYLTLFNKKYIFFTFWKRNQYGHLSMGIKSLCLRLSTYRPWPRHKPAVKTTLLTVIPILTAKKDSHFCSKSILHGILCCDITTLLINAMSNEISISQCHLM